MLIYLKKGASLFCFAGMVVSSRNSIFVEYGPAYFFKVFADLVESLGNSNFRGFVVTHLC